MPTLASYDELPYDSLPLPETQPDVIAALARLHGFDAPDPCRARILELGCAQGGNLIPLAWRWPESECVGVELSQVQAAAGNAFIAELGLSNCTIIHADLAALPESLGEFDFIIAHGVFSWVPPAVQTALLAVCRRYLSAQGVAYVSFNVTAGWRALQPLRDALIERTDATQPAPVRYRQALAVLDALATEWDDPLLLKEIAYLKTAAPSYLFHEYLAECNAPVSFNDFASQLDQQGLRYLGEAGPRRACVALENTWGLLPDTLNARWLEAEFALDETLNTRFRRAMLTRADAACAQPPQPEALMQLAFYADLASDEELDLTCHSEQQFVNPAGNRFPLASPAIKAAAMVLSAHYPLAIGYADLHHAATRLLHEQGLADAGSEAEFRAALFDLVVLQAVMPTVWQGSFADEPGAFPHAHALARAQAHSPGWVVSGARHVAVDLDHAGRRLLGALDGTRSVAELAVWMHDELADVNLSSAYVAERTQQQLWLYVRQGMLGADAA